MKWCKIGKKCIITLFGIRLWKVSLYHKLQKYMSNECFRSHLSFAVCFLVFWAFGILENLRQKKYWYFFNDFYTNFMVKGAYFWYIFFYLWPKWLWDEFTIHFIYSKLNYGIFIFIFFRFFGHNLKNLKFWHFSRKNDISNFCNFNFEY